MDAASRWDWGAVVPYELVWESRCLTRRYRGHVSGDELVASLREMSADPRIDEVRACIADYSAVESLRVSEDDAALVAALQIGSRYSNPGLLLTGVATDPDLIAELQRLASLFQPDTSIRCHPTLDAARRWIRIQGSLEGGPA